MRCSANIATRLSRAQFNELEVSIPTRSLVDCITIMSEFDRAQAWRAGAMSLYVRMSVRKARCALRSLSYASAWISAAFLA